MAQEIILNILNNLYQARILEWVANPFSRGTSWPRDWTEVSRIAGRIYVVRATMEVTKGKESEKIYIYIITVLHFKKRMGLGFWLSGKWGWPQYQWTMESWDSLDTMTSKLPKLIKNEQSCLNNVVVCNTAPTEGKTLSAPQLLIWPSWYYQWLFTRVMGCDDYLRLMPVSDSLQKEIQELRALNYQPNAWLQNCVRTLRIPYLW